MAPPLCEELGGGDEEAGTDKMGEDRDSCYDSQASVRPKVKDPEQEGSDKERQST